MITPEVHDQLCLAIDCLNISARELEAVSINLQLASIDRPAKIVANHAQLVESCAKKFHKLVGEIISSDFKQAAESHKNTVKAALAGIGVATGEKEKALEMINAIDGKENK